MGMEQTVRLPGTVPTWEAIRDLLASRSFPVRLQMIDGELAFPDELPGPDWHELRVGTPDGTVTVRRAAEAVTLVTWGNADASLRRAWNVLTWAYAQAGGGTILTVQGEQTADQYRQSADLPASWR